MWDLHSFSLISAMFLVTVESPPNPEDGELWLPSDVFREIDSCGSMDISPRSNSSSIHQEDADKISVDRDPFDLVVGLSGPKEETEKPSKNFKEIRGLKRVMGDYYHNGAWKSVRGDYYGGIAQRHHGGTGVFLPRHHRRPSMEAELRIMAATATSRGGTGVFISRECYSPPPPPPPHRRTKSCGVKMESKCNDRIRSWIAGFNGSQREKDMAAGGKPPSAVKSQGTTHLPDDWMY